MIRSTSDLVLVLLVAIAVHAPFLRDGYLTDDFVHLARTAAAPSIRPIVTEPDTFGFFRPLTHASYWIEQRVSPESGGRRHRITNVVLHAAVVALAFVLGQQLLRSRRAAFVAALAFALAPKANTIAVLWIAGRAELLMSTFALLALLAWLQWCDRGRGWMLGAAMTCYVLAILSKETAILLPALAVVVPPPGATTMGRRAGGAGALAVGGVVTYFARSLTGAVVPPASDTFYSMLTPWTIWAENAMRYAGRVLLAPALVLVTCLVAIRGGGLPHVASTPAPDTRGSSIGWLTALAALWFGTFMLPVLPVFPRSEIRVYLAGLGLCFLAGALVLRFEQRHGWRRRTNLALAACVIVLGGYQTARAAEAARDMAFSSALITAIRQDTALSHHRGRVLLVPATPEIKQLLRDSIGDYLDRILRSTFGRRDIDGVLVEQNPGPAAAPGDLRLVCEYVEGRVVLRPEQP